MLQKSVTMLHFQNRKCNTRNLYFIRVCEVESAKCYTFTLFYKKVCFIGYF